MIYVLSDIHGNESNFNSILNQIHLRPEDTLYVLGDVIDRYPGGIRILRRLMAMDNVKMIPGNHEYMMLRALGHPLDDNYDDGGAMAHWYRNGGNLTHAHWKRIRKSLRREIIEYLHSLPLNRDVHVNGTHYKLVHGGAVEEFDPADPQYKSPTYFAVWKRFQKDYTFSGDYTLIFGHTPTRYFQDISPLEIFQSGQLLGIDCGSGYPAEGADGYLGRLACLRLDDGKVFYSGEGRQ